MAAWAREARETEAAAALAGAPMQTGLPELAGFLLMLTEISCRPEQRWVGGQELEVPLTTCAPQCPGQLLYL